MLRNYVTTVLRNLFKNKFYMITSLLGLSVAMTACLMIFHYVSHEKSYDQFNSNIDRIYRIEHHYYEGGDIRSRSARTAAAVGPALKQDFSEVENYVKFLGWFGNNKFSAGDVTYLENKILFVTPSFFDVFSYPMLKGDGQAGLTGPNKVIITESIAKKYFGAQDPVGKELLLQDSNNSLRLAVSGVCADAPKNSHVKFDFLVSFDTFVSIKGEDALNSWTWTNFYTYVLLKPENNIASLESKMPKFIDSHLGHLKQSNIGVDFKFQPLADIHLYSRLEYELNETGSGRTLKFLIIIAVFILVIAWVNYVNLSTANGIERAKEVGVRKVMGADRKQLLGQFMVESFLINAMAMTVSIGIFIASFPLFVRMVGNSDLSIELTNYQFWLIVLALFVFGIALSGLYPALVLSSFKPIRVLKGKLSHSSHGILMRKALVAFQFVIAMFLIGGTLTVYKQLNHMLQADLGASIDQILVVNTPIVRDDAYANKMDLFKNQLLKYPAIKNATASTTVPSQRGLRGMGARAVNRPDATDVIIEVAGVDHNFIPTYSLQLLAGRNFDINRPGDQTSVVLSMQAARLFGFATAEEAINSEINIPGPPDQPVTNLRVIGVTKDYYHNSVLGNLLPIVFVLDTNSNQFFSFKVSVENLTSTIEEIQNAWDKTFSGNIMRYFFLDDTFNQQYGSIVRFEKIFRLFSTLAIVIACMGLLGLSAFTAQQKANEICVRKIVGASVNDVVILLSRGYLSLLLISSVLAIPIMFYACSNWLDNFAYRIEIEWWMIVIPSIMVFIISMLAVSYYTLKAAFINPAAFMRSE